MDDLPPPNLPLATESGVTRKRKRGRPRKDAKKVGNTVDGQSIPSTYSSTANSSCETYEIEGVVARRKCTNGNYEYLLRWKNYTPADDTWEPRKTLLEDGLTGIVPYFDALWESGEKRYLSLQEFKAVALKQLQNVEEDVKPFDSFSDDCLQTGATDRYMPHISSSIDDQTMYAGATSRSIKPTLSDGILTYIPRGRELDRILGVTVFRANLVHLVKWKTEDSEEEGDINHNKQLLYQDLHNWNSNIVLASAMNKAFPQEVIKYYEGLSQQLEPQESEQELLAKALRSFEDSKKRKIAERQSHRRLAVSSVCNDSDSDDATAALNSANVDSRFDVDMCSESSSDIEMFEENDIESLLE